MCCLCSILWIGWQPGCVAQSLSGYVWDERNEPIPYANIFVRELNTGTPTNARGYYFLTLDPGIYNVVVSSIGYETQAVRLIVRDKPLEHNFTLQTSSTELSEVVVKASRRDPAFEIIQKTIERKEHYLTQASSARMQVYVRAMETMDRKKKTVAPPPDELERKGPPGDPFEQAKQKEAQRLLQINLLEMQLTLHFQAPDLYKEERTGYKAYGSKEGLFVPIFSQADFNFYHNLVDLKGISEVPLISPISRTAILSYKYKLEGVLKENDRVVYKIRVMPRKTGDATCKGFVFINDSTWNLNRLELTLEKGGLRFYDQFTIRQTYEELAPDFWIPTRQDFTYETKAGATAFKGTTALSISQYEKDVVFPERFFGNEVSVITKEAYKRDTAYWNRARRDPLTPDQQKVIRYRDSVEAAHSSKKYLDSILARYNKVTVGEVLYNGFGFRNDSLKREISFPSLLSTIGFEVIGGWRVGPNVWRFKRYESGRTLSTAGGFNYGFKNNDLQGSASLWYRYNPYRLGDIAVRGGRSFQSINSFDAYLNQLRISNYILHDFVSVFHRIELFNGFYVSLDAGIHNRKSLEDYDRTSIINQVIEETEPILFEGYQALISNLQLSYTPGQRFMTEPNRKIVLGSRFPTFHVTHRKGWNGPLSSDIDFDYIEASIEQNLLLGTLGNSRYRVELGKFVNARDLRYVDVKRFRQSDPILYSDPMRSFQLLDTALYATDWFFEAHYIHHFNGALINNLPLIKKTKIRTVAGAGMMWIRENGFFHQELFGGIERVFKLGARRRLRVGAYAVVAQSNFAPARTDFKVSFDLIDTWKRDWSF